MAHDDGDNDYVENDNNDDANASGILYLFWTGVLFSHSFQRVKIHLLNYHVNFMLEPDTGPFKHCHKWTEGDQYLIACFFW